MTPENWKPSEGIDLEKNAEIVARSLINHLVVAGPGAGKTELLAQRASFLLETNLCLDPRRILAISFKRDAADNLRERVAVRCSPVLASRFDSHTFDSFAKGILDRFREGLAPTIDIPPDYEIEEGTAFFNRVGAILEKLRKIEPYSNARGAVYLSPKPFVEKHLCAAQLSAFASPQNDFEIVAKGVWQFLLREETVTLSFDMVKRLAERIVDKNPHLARALRITYSHVFLDEFQDTTRVQFDLLKTCFPGRGTVLTAVGDNKQRIMLWANAMPDAFEKFEEIYAAERVQLVRNRRSDCRLVEIQDFLIAAIDPSSPKVEPAPDKMDGDGVCEILEFENELAEATCVASMAAGLLEQGVLPNDICIIVKQTVARAVQPLITAANELGIRCRVEEPYQAVMKDELVETILSILFLAVEVDTAKHWNTAFRMTCELYGIDENDTPSTYSAEALLNNFIVQLAGKLVSQPTSADEYKWILEEIIAFLGTDRIRSTFSKHLNPNSVPRLVGDLAKLFAECSEVGGSWASTLNRFTGKDAIPAMTIHKSKGLEYHTVFFIGLEDSSWWNFANQAEEDTCSFFVAFSRAKKQVYFTFCHHREAAVGRPQLQQRKGISSLYQLLMQAGVRARNP
jgi:superfamily I DNA/RNA helicase